jgi:hypothetical protein
MAGVCYLMKLFIRAKMLLIAAGWVLALLAGMVRDALTPADGDSMRIALLDWEGLFAQRYELAGADYNILLFDRSGKLLYSAALQAFEQQRMAAVLRDLRAPAAQL